MFDVLCTHTIRHMWAKYRLHIQVKLVASTVPWFKHFAVDLLVQGQLVTCPSKYKGVTMKINSCTPTFSSHSY